jgi:hypothetical protein
MSVPTDAEKAIIKVVASMASIGDPFILRFPTKPAESAAPAATTPPADW